jgi:hypothetical protein
MRRSHGAGNESGDDLFSQVHINPASIRTAPPVHDQPEATLLLWRAVRLFSGDCVLIGCLECGLTIRITTSIVRYMGRRAWTESGRQYNLLGDPAIDARTIALLCERLATSNHLAYIDCTEQFLAGTLKV